MTVTEPSPLLGTYTYAFAFATAGLICPTPVCEYTPATVVDVGGSVVDGAVLVVDGSETVCVVVVTWVGADVLDEFSVDDGGSAVTASVARELEAHAAATRDRTPINIVATTDDRAQPSRRREVDTP